MGFYALHKRFVYKDVVVSDRLIYGWWVSDKKYGESVSWSVEELLNGDIVNDEPYDDMKENFKKLADDVCIKLSISYNFWEEVKAISQRTERIISMVKRIKQK